MAEAETTDRDIADFGASICQVGGLLTDVGIAISDAHAEGLRPRPVCRGALKSLRDARERIAALIAEIEAESRR